MNTPKRIDRKEFLTGSVAALGAVTLGACSGESEDGGASGGGTSGAGGAGTGGTGNGGTAGQTMGGSSGSGTTGGSAGSGMTGGSGGAGTSGGGTGGAGTGGGGTGGGGTGGGGGSTFVCMADTDNGNHSHDLTIPSEDVERGEQSAPYLLEDGGTGHTHQLPMSPYEYLYLQVDGVVTVESTMDAGHSHMCVITCTME